MLARIEQTALRAAERQGVPLAFAAGRVVVLVTETTPIAGLNMSKLRGWLVSRQCESAAHARATADRAVADLDLYRNTHNPKQALEVSAQYAEAAIRHASRTRRTRR